MSLHVNVYNYIILKSIDFFACESLNYGKNTECTFNTNLTLIFAFHKLKMSTAIAVFSLKKFNLVGF